MEKVMDKMLYGLALVLALTGVASLVMGVIYTVKGNWDLALTGYGIFPILTLVALFMVGMIQKMDEMSKW